MIKPTLKRERQLFKKKFLCIAGVDEVGRGAWAGPVVAAAILIDPAVTKNLKSVSKIRDSKLLSDRQRRSAYEYLVEHFHFGVGIIDSPQIDQRGIQTANQCALRLAVAALEIRPDYVLCDGRGFKFFGTAYESIVDGDAKVFSIAAASIIAKVIRDQIMQSYAQVYPNYGFARHKGYGTFKHRRAIAQLGVLPIHRCSYQPIKTFIETNFFDVVE